MRGRSSRRGPYHLLGWSLGGNIAHEMAVRLQDIGEDVASLTILDAMAGHRPSSMPAHPTRAGHGAAGRAGPGDRRASAAHRRGPRDDGVPPPTPRIRRRCDAVRSPRGSPTGVLHWASCGSRSSGERWRSSWWTARHADMSSAAVLDRVGKFLEGATGGEP
ncbi:hypothetical protein GS426_20045 [Rhodococcus hoagii]|nr:hypothetical protein [Prescottella equi]